MRTCHRTLLLLAAVLLAGASDAVTGPVVGWGANGFGQASPPASVDGSEGLAGALASGPSHSLAIYLPEPSATALQTSGCSCSRCWRAAGHAARA